MFSQAVISQSFPGWQDFPKGLHVLLVDDDDAALQEAKVKLAACDYKVTPCSSGQQALAALEERGSSFHIALIEQETSNDANDGLKLVRAVSQHLPTILMSKTKNVSFMMEGIAAGASECLQKPLSEDQLKTIWQHVFRKALCSREVVIPCQRVSPPNSPGTSPVCSSGPAQPAGNSSCSHSSASACDDSVSPNAASTFSQHGTNLPNMDVDPPFLTMPEGDESQDHEHVDDHEKPCLDCNLFLLSSPLASPGPSTPQIEQAARLKLEEDDSLLSQGIISYVKAENDSEIVDDCSTHAVEVKTEVEDYADNIHGFVNQGDQSEGDECNANDFEGLDPKLCDGLEFDCHLGDITLSNDMVSELSSLDASILDDLSADGSMVLSFDCLDDVDGGNHHMQEADEEALLLAEVAKAEAGMAATASNLALINASKTPPSASTMTCTSTTTSSSTSCANVDFEKKADNGSDSDHSSGRGSKSLHSKKKMKVDWTPDLHRRFVQAVEQLGVDKAIPSRILELMGVQCLTRHNIASHLQKYRSHKKHLHAREVEAASWNQRRQFEAMPRPSAQAQPVSRSAPFPIATTGGPALHVWGHPTPDHFWPKPWQAPDGTFWHQPAPVCVDAWGHPTPFYPQPVLRLPLAPLPGVGNRTAAKPVQQPEKMSLCHPAKETVDAAINEVLKNPFTPLPLGLKPPSWESVVSELQRQGIQTLSPAVSS